LSDSPLQGLRVLVMEDEYLIAMDVEQMCRDHGAEEVFILRRLDELGDDPLSLLKFHLAIVDVRLGGDTTLEFARQLAEKRIPFVFATGYAETEQLFEAFPGVAVIGKPYAGDVLIDALCAAIERQRVSGGA
jgi:CheY-like chemotaxis protein